MNGFKAPALHPSPHLLLDCWTARIVVGSAGWCSAVGN